MSARTANTGSPARDVRRGSYPLGEEIANAVTHGVGAALALAGLVVLVVLAVRHGGTRYIASAVVYGASMLLLYLSSTLYHSLPQPRAKHVFKFLDHAVIYVLIAGTYTPFTLITLRGPVGWTLFGVVWALAAAGIVLESVWIYRPKWLSVPIYVAMGWLVLFAIKPVVASLPGVALGLLVAGGVMYTLGTVFYGLKRVPYMHMVWHLFVLVGSACHFCTVALHVLPGKV